ncbi:hypothetical protein OCC_01284 [Thermococcus litoralis DSM 5473]|uniref:Uncharacterized protein n=1 Tax=Thermococcus litoralis (strain ATCC 51850 / DSM 5473 / JCM 8560 / NS-C) TaxID=523849 RepID=H3ZLQ8_THELN|nr:hypothetical protein [Thermococcus litoralis]EHR79120.1 hypothetical protein OCC_01284 [Thermococcus litoralis DSM 5473]
MIWGIVAVIGGLILGSKAVVLIPLVYLLTRKSKDLGLLAYFFYGIVLVNEVSFSDVISFGSLKGFLLGVVPSLGVLREILVGFEFGKIPKFRSFSDLVRFVGNKSYFYKTMIFLVVVFALIAVIKMRYSYLYTAENQVTILAALTLLFVLFNMKEVKKTVMFELEEKL